MTARQTYLDGLKDAATMLDNFRSHAQADDRVLRAWALGYNLIAKTIDRTTCTDCPDSGMVLDDRGRTVECTHPNLTAPWTAPIPAPKTTLAAETNELKG